MNLNKRRNLLLFSLAAETLFASYGLLPGSHTAVDTILYLVASLVFTVAILRMPAARLPRWKDFKNESVWKLPLLILMILSAFVISRYWLFQVPLDPDYADMLPVMKVMNERFLHGNLRQVYTPIPEIWNGIHPIYLPAMWLPYAPAVAMHIDIRWVTVIAVLFSFTIILLSIGVKRNGYFGYGLITITALLFWWIFARNDIHNLISMSEEGVVIFYFVLLTEAIISGSAVFIGIAASLCLLSRYSMIGWVLPYLLYLLTRREFRKLIIFSTTGIVFLLLFFLIPFGFETLDMMFALPGNYVAFAKHIWEFSPEVYWLNLGLAKFYGPHNVDLLHKTLLWVSFVIPCMLMGFFLVQKKWKLQNINLACFKISLLVFYQFIDVPYGYLFYTCTFVSLVIAVNFLSVVNGVVNVEL